MVVVINKHHFKDIRMDNSDLELVIMEEDNSYLNLLHMLLRDNQEAIISFVSKFKAPLGS